MDLLKEIGAILGFVAFGGLAVLAFLTFQQARHLRRLREWAGRQPERAEAKADRVAELAGEATTPAIEGDEPAEKGPSRLDRLRGEAAVRMEELDRRSPVDPKILLGGLVAVLIGVGIATSGFGLLGGDSTGEETTTAESSSASEEKIEVAVLNGTAPEEGAVGVAGVANRASKLVKDAGYKVGEVETAPGSFPISVVMFEEGSKSDARELVAALEESFGPTEVEVMTPEIQSLAKNAALVLVVGVDDGGI